MITSPAMVFGSQIFMDKIICQITVRVKQTDGWNVTFLFVLLPSGFPQQIFREEYRWLCIPFIGKYARQTIFLLHMIKVETSEV
jgi:hypothetical protein